MSGPPPLPPTVGNDYRSIERRCRKCGQPVGEDYWCEQCAAKRQRLLLTNVAGACVFFGFWSCSIGTGFFSYRNPEPWMLTLQYVGTALFMGGPIVCGVLYLVSTLRAEGRRRG